MKQKLLPAAGIVLSLLFCSCTREAQEKPTTSAQEKPTTHAQEKTSLPEVISLSSLRDGKTEIEYSERRQQHKIELQGSKITGLFIDGKKMPEETLVMHQASMQKILQHIEADQQKMEKGLLPPLAKGPEAGNISIEAINLTSHDKMNAPAKEKRDKEAVEAERNAANKTGSQK
jgi:hypothetical protein